MEMSFCEPLSGSKQLLTAEAGQGLVGNAEGQGRGPWLIEHVSSLDVGSRGFQHGKEPVEHSVSEQQCCLELNNALSNYNIEGEATSFGVCSCVGTPAKSEVATGERGGFNGELENNILLEEVSGIERRVISICLSESSDKNESNAYHLDPEGASLKNVLSFGKFGLKDSSRNGQMTSEVPLITCAAGNPAPEDESNYTQRQMEAMVQKSDATCGSQVVLDGQVLRSFPGHMWLDLASTIDNCTQQYTNDSGCEYGVLTEEDFKNFEQNCDVSNSNIISKTVPLQPCSPTRAVDDRHLFVPDISMSDGLLVAAKSVVADAPCHVCNEGDDYTIIGDDSEAKSSGIQSSLRRSSRSKRCVQKAEGRKYVRKCSKKAFNMSLLDGVSDVLLKARRKRSCISKSAHSSGWGSMMNLLKYFEQTDGVAVTKVLNKRSRKFNHRQKSRKQNKIQACMSSKGSKGTKCFPSGRIRLKVIFGKEARQNKVEVMAPVGHANLATDCSCDGDNHSNFGENQQAVFCSEHIEVGNRVDDIIGEKIPGIAPVCFSTKNMEESITCQKNSMVNVHPVDKAIKISFISDKTLGYCCKDSSKMEVEKCGHSNGDRYFDPGTSPDSEVINQVPDSQIGVRALEVLHDLNHSSKATACTANAKVPASSRKIKVKGRSRKKEKLPEASSFNVEDRLPEPDDKTKAKISKKSGRQKNKNNRFCFSDSGILESIGNSSRNPSVSKQVSAVQLPIANMDPTDALKLAYDTECNMYGRTDAGFESAESWNSKKLLSPTAAQGKKVLKAKGKSRNKSKNTDAARSQMENSHRPKGSRRKLGSKRRVSENGIAEGDEKMEIHSETGKHGTVEAAKTNSNRGAKSGDASNQAIVLSGGCGGEQTLGPRRAWVCCDDCDKWRCIAADLADVIEEKNCRWTCKDNQDKAFADCSIPQEKSNAEINVELEISDEEDACDARLGSKGYRSMHATVAQQNSWVLIKSNLFLHRSRKTQTMDEIMVCHCKPPPDGSLGCGDECLNRMLNIECVRGTCPCGDLCSNLQFQKRKYAKLNWFRCGKKGYGLQVLQDISQGHFLIEYVGEVLDLQTYESRQREYASKGHKHFYFMTLNGNEVIDACAKGNLGRFINHSCDPNCRTEKWMVNGEICIGLFAIRNIKKGEELTFDYNYVRVFGAAAKKCYCGAAQCLGYIGGDPLNAAEVIVQGESDDEFPEPVVIYQDGETNSMESTVSTSSMDVAETEIADMLPDLSVGISSEDKGLLNEAEKPANVVGVQLVTSMEKDSAESVNDYSKIHVRSKIFEASRTEDLFHKHLSPGQHEIPPSREAISTSSLSTQISESPSQKRILRKFLSESVDAGTRKFEAEMAEGKRVHSKLHPCKKIPYSFKSVKNHKSNSNSVNEEKALLMANQSHVFSHKPKKVLESSAHCHFEAVEEKLNDLLDADGGICKRRDASRGYLKLLLLTAVSGDNGNGGTIQSNRDLSMILDAILKTKSRGVLVDIINKNGLQMLHNIMKQYRRDFKKIPILRKLLKVLEYLAEKEILTGERINADPHCLGVESFRESILALAEHEDKKVHQIARNFRDKWIPRVRKISHMEPVDRKMEANWASNFNRYMGSHRCRRDQEVRPSEAIDCTKLSTLSSNPLDDRTLDGSSAQVSGCIAAIAGSRKRKSRWDRPADPVSPRSCNEQQILSDIQQKFDSSPQLEIGGEKSCTGPTCEHIECSKADSGGQDTSLPPGFSSPPPGFSSPPPGFSSHLSGSELQTIACSPGNDIARQNTGHVQHPSEVSLGHLQERFNSCLPIAYGIPFSVIEQFGTPHTELVGSWAVGPGMPFHPFPPLPPYPRGCDERDSQRSCVGYTPTISGSSAQVQEDGHLPAPCHGDQGMPSTSITTLSDVRTPTANNHILRPEGGYSYNLGKRFFRQQRWNNLKLRPPWLRRRNGWGFDRNYPANRAFGPSIGTIAEQNGQHSEDIV
ncbi:hypothetical protein Nepgr_024155 [Nepenthes gracilis]|uniref:Histone-lysine N-methyltransferase ASHH2 n=1 Tax=Nepenthes gracilis TaxID=150966 RepID=A0AAD3T444_NEPGR|nr:hypothetical protein Nepgr_024155 [Nepenthes gracilis]